MEGGDAMNMTERVTGKQVLSDAVTLVKDTGLFVFDLGKLIVYKISELLKSDREKKPAVQSKQT